MQNIRPDIIWVKTCLKSSTKDIDTAKFVKISAQQIAEQYSKNKLSIKEWNSYSRIV